nr:lactate racemase domain-containing protein [Microlunatus panaciterrae]
MESGDGHVDVDLPDHAVVIQAGEAEHEPVGLADPVGATRYAIQHPLDSRPLPELVGAGSRVTIAFPDRVKGGTQPTAHRRVTIPLVVEELERAGVRRRDITLVCAIGLHRKNTAADFEAYLGRDVLDLFEPEQIVNHDAEDPDGIVALEPSELGDVVEMNRLVAESDLTILISHAAGNPYGGFSGGYKMPSTGLTTWRSIRGHHSPSSLHRSDFIPISTGSRFRHQLAAIGRRMEAALPQPFFTIDAVLNARSEQVQVRAGSIPAVEQATWPTAGHRTELTIPGEAADILLVGMPRNFHYGNGMGSNPVLMMQAIGASVARAKAALKPYPVVIATSVCDGWFNAEEFPSYQHTYELLQTVHRPADMVSFEDEVCTDPGYVDAYRHRLAYHPFHAFSMIYMGGLARERTSAVYIAGAASPGYARGMGAIPTRTVEDALAEARRHTGNDARILVVPSLSRPAYHLRSATA